MKVMDCRRRRGRETLKGWRNSERKERKIFLLDLVRYKLLIRDISVVRPITALTHLAP